MDEDNTAERCSKSRAVLGNITNQLKHKRPFSSILGNSSLKSVDRGRENPGSKFVSVYDVDDAKRVCHAPHPCNKIRSSNVDVISGVSNVPSQNQDSNLSSDNNENNDARGSVIEIIDDMDGIPKKNLEVVNDMDGLVNQVSIPVPELSGIEDRDHAQSCENIEDTISSEGTESDVDVFPNIPDEQGFDNLIMSQSGSVDFARLPESQESRVVLDTCLGSQTWGDNSGIDSTQGCSCTFCTKAAYIWLDLHYQDIKGRISAIKKSQREASILVERSCKGKGLQIEGPENKFEAAYLESSLMGQWKSLFQQMEHIFQGEADQLEGSCVALTNLKEKCKAELNSCNATRENC